MTDKVQSDKSAEEILAEVVKSEIAATAETKADKASLEEVKSANAKLVIDIEAVKSDSTAAVEAAKQSILDTIEMKFNALPAIIPSQGETKSMETKFNVLKDGDHAGHMGLEVEYKAYNDNTNVLGAPVQGKMPFYTLEQMNIFRQGLSTMFTANSGSVKLPSSNEIVFATEDTVDTGRTQQGGLASTTIIIDNYVASSQWAKPSIEDIPGLDSVIMNQYMQALGKKEHEDMVTALNAATITEVNTGVAAGLPAKDDIIEHVADLQAALSSAYLPGAMWVVSRAFLSRVRSAADGEYAYDPAMGTISILGYPVMVSDYVDSGNAAGNNAAYFGNFGAATIIAQRKSLTIGRYMETSPGFITYFGEARSKMAVWDVAGLVRSNTAA